MTHIARIAYAIHYATLRAAIRAIDAELNAKPQRQPVLYHGCRQPINTHERWLRRR